MTQSTIDARGQACPMPMMLTQKALKDPQVSDPFVILLSTDSARENVERFLQGQKRGYVVTRNGDEIKITVSRAGPLVMHPETSCSPGSTSGGCGCC